ncbi:DUF1735 domain-containing protein [Cytophagaceae bacterium DM2B3-1]|uniref:DUF1735 domain-containing protein n=1 Tax=Xanthocytophaga flava TaxID=3048013 RepID=A0AAE3QP17_9BACT|nr:DUF1735 domain-containing protein [Xanthocytophaga flavus]MDJ1467392.1 DUF1735 domain-containing protein [Xanthocytophaga flavus]MDJ1480068.1 DUF1735 domain-containing protein [Xanthocytophaga flavus]MDJ1498069.1 DUF1735 domain-containing protein [Xanthocytophaga flavus]
MKRPLYVIISFCCLVLGLSSCLEDVGYTDIVESKNAQMIASFYGSQGGNLLVEKFVVDSAKKVELTVTVAGQFAPDKDYAVTVSGNQAALDKYNSIYRIPNGDEAYTLLPTEAYTIEGPIVVKKGEKDASFNVVVTVPSGLDFSKDYALALAITDASGATIASNVGYTVIAITGLPNAYEGNYHSTGFFQHPTSPRDINRDKHLSSIDKFTSETEFADLAGNYKMWLKVNKDNTVTITPKETAASVSSFQQTGTNKYDPETKTFTLNYKYVGSNGDRIINETLVKK